MGSPAEWSAVIDKLIGLIAAITALVGVIYGARKWPQIRESLRPKRNRDAGLEPSPFSVPPRERMEQDELHYVEIGPVKRDSRRPPLPPDEMPTLRPRPNAPKRRRPL